MYTYHDDTYIIIRVIICVFYSPQLDDRHHVHVGYKNSLVLSRILSVSEHTAAMTRHVCISGGGGDEVAVQNDCLLATGRSSAVCHIASYSIV